MVCKDTLRIKHLPKELTDAQKEDFVRHFGALKVKVITSKAKAKSVIYAKFENEDIAKNVMTRLHQISILNCRLCVEYAETDVLQGQLVSQKVDEVHDGPDKKIIRNFINNVNAFNDSVGFYQPPPSHLKYNYPKANRPTINNIAHALATVPRFYTQVLHLMNKMNLPPPFAMPEPPVRVIPAPAVVQNPAQKREALSSSESELESDGETNKNKEIIPEKKVIQKKPIKRLKFIKQPIVQPNISSKPIEKAENVFEKVDVVAQRKIELKVIQDPAPNKSDPVKEKNNEPMKNETKPASEPKPPEKTPDKKLNLEQKQPDSSPTKAAIDKPESEPIAVKLQPPEPLLVEPQKLDTLTKPLETLKELDSNIGELQADNELNKSEIAQELKEIQPPILDSLDQSKESIEGPLEPTSSEDAPCISLEELAANQITDLSTVAVFKNYNPGEPTNKLYIKNCAKTVVVQDLEYIFNRYREESTEEKSSEFNIRLMQEGRMKGQAFVTLDSAEQAQRAVKETNGFILKDKPLVVVFGKAGKKK